MTAKLKEAHEAALTEAQSARKTFIDLRNEQKKAGVDFADDDEAFAKMDEVAKIMSTADEKAADLGTKLVAASGWDSSAPDLGEQIGEQYGSDDPKGKNRPPGVSEAAHRILQGDGYKALLESGRLTSKADIGSHELGMALKRHELKTLLTGADPLSAGAFVEEDRKPMVPLLDRPITITQLVGQGTTDSDTVEWVEQVTQPTAAAPVAEAVDTTTGNKPESGMTFVVTNAVVENIAHFIPATRRAIADAGQLSTIIDQEMLQGLDRELEDQIVTGAGAGNDFDGLLANAGNTVAKGVTEPIADVLHRALTTIRLEFCEPTVIGLHPSDWERLRLEKDLNDNYLYGPPALSGDRQAWGVPIVMSTVFTEGEALIGDYARASTLWMREGMIIRVSDSHDDFFIKNIVVILAEMRAAFAVQQPNCLATATALNV